MFLLLSKFATLIRAEKEVSRHVQFLPFLLVLISSSIRLARSPTPILGSASVPPPHAGHVRVRVSKADGAANKNEKKWKKLYMT